MCAETALILKKSHLTTFETFHFGLFSWMFGMKKHDAPSSQSRAF